MKILVFLERFIKTIKMSNSSEPLEYSSIFVNMNFLLNNFLDRIKIFFPDLDNHELINLRGYFFEVLKCQNSDLYVCLKDFFTEIEKILEIYDKDDYHAKKEIEGIENKIFEDYNIIYDEHYSSVLIFNLFRIINLDMKNICENYNNLVTSKIEIVLEFIKEFNKNLCKYIEYRDENISIKIQGLDKDSILYQLCKCMILNNKIDGEETLRVLTCEIQNSNLLSDLGPNLELLIMYYAKLHFFSDKTEDEITKCKNEIYAITNSNELLTKEAFIALFERE